MHYEKGTCKYNPCIPSPTILQINQESRLEGLKIYHELCLGPLTVTGCYVNLSVDTVYFTSDVEDPDDSVADPISIGQVPRGALFLEPLADPHFNVGNGSSSVLLHSMVILNDLLESPDVEQLFDCLHLCFLLWTVPYPIYRSYRHRLTSRVKEFCIVYEWGDGPLNGGLKLEKIVVSAETPVASGLVEPPLHPQDKITIAILRAFTAQHVWTNLSDMESGLPAVLSLNFNVGILKRG